MKMRLIGLGLIAASAAPAFAQGSPLDKVYACAAKTADAERLACYDAAIGDLKQAQTTGGIAVVNSAQIAAAEKEAFGLEAPSLSQLARSASPTTNTPDLERVDVTIKTAERRANGSFRFTLDNGQVWEQIDTYELGRTLTTPVQAEIRKASLNSFMLKPANRSAVRVRRIK